MTKLGKKHQKRVAKLVAAALVCAGGLCSFSSVAMAVKNLWIVVNDNDKVTAEEALPVGAGLDPNVNSTGTKSLTITTGDWGGWYIHGGYNSSGTFASGAVDGYSLTLDRVVSKTEGNYIRALFGGYSTKGNVTNNWITLKNVDIIVSDDIYGGNATFDDHGAENNHVVIEGGTIKAVGFDSGLGITGGSIYGGVTMAGTGNAVGNTISVSDDATVSVYNGIYGGSANQGNATDNTVTISGGTITGNIYGGQSYSGATNDNTVEISGGTINGYIYGGMGSTEASGNTVTISGDAIINALDSAYIYGGTGAPIAKNNTINILTQISVRGLYGGIDSSAGDGNTLNVNATGVTVGDNGVYGFQNMNFFLPDGAAGKTMLTVNEKDPLTGGGVATDLKGVAIGAAVQAGANFNKGDIVNLITNPSGLTTDGTTTMKQITDKTVTIQTKPTAKTLTTDQSYKLEVSQKDANTIVATITDKEEKQNGDRAKSLVETRAATTTFVNAGADMLASQGFAQAANAVALEAAEKVNANEQGATGTPAPNAFTPFAAFGGSSMRAESGSYVNTKGFGLNIGFARELSNAQGKLLFGPMVEYGGGSYDSHLDDGTRGDGKAHYFGVGVMARQVNHDGFYYEGSLRGGRVTSDYDGNLDGVGKVDYDSSSNYFAAHLGAGKAFDLGKSNTLDGYFKYFYSHQAGDDTTVHIAGMDDERGHFDAVDSHRIRIGARLTHKVNERNSFYGGLAYQYEFNGDARATFSGNGVPSPSLKGSSGMLELGWQVKPGDGPLTLDLGVTGWAGKQRGGSVQLGATWTF